MFVNADGGLTTAGYVLFIVLAVIALLAASVIAGKVSKKGKMSAKQIAFCSMAIALAYVTSYIKLFSLPFSGSVTLCSMLFIVLVGYWYGPATGILVGFVCSSFRSRTTSHFFRCARITCWHFPHSGSPVSSPEKRTVLPSAIWSVSSEEAFSTRWPATCTGWSICRKLFRNHWRLFTRSFIISDSCWLKQ